MTSPSGIRASTWASFTPEGLGEFKKAASASSADTQAHYLTQGESYHFKAEP